ncbi:MAG: NAD(P)-binding domain-containing protein [Steroidobacteraceae bacterium]|nr:NAD(P)-binding domain-containing protein [Steroidobacteraceae bacterium]MDW8260542.1 NAD(P)-binding domain-containing protein [Gammaproteobacteria bacterium]
MACGVSAFGAPAERARSLCQRHGACKCRCLSRLVPLGISLCLCALLPALPGATARAMLPAEAARACSRLFLAVPWQAAATSVRSLGDLRGKLLIDATNPLTVRAGREVELPAQPSAAEQLQAWAPGATVVKAFNTLSYRVMADPEVAGGPVSVPLSGDDAAAKAEVAELVRRIGLEPVDVGPLYTARYTERMALLYVGLSVRGAAHEFYLRPRPQPRTAN